MQSNIIHPASDENGAVPTLKIKLDPAGLGKDAFQVSLEIRDGDPRMWVYEKNLPDNILTIIAVSLTDELVDVVGRRLREILET